nr:NAD(+)--rifampin ADP-ribosyltransferase [Actinotalea ferrariae]
MTFDSRHLSVRVDRPVAQVYAFASDPANLPGWAPGLGTSVVHEGDAWFVETPGGRARITFAPPNELGVLDHDVVTPSGRTVHVPMRVVAYRESSEVIFTLRPEPGATDADLEADAALVAADLARLKEVVERELPDPGPFFHGTRADLQPGDLVEPGRASNFGARRAAAFVYLTATLDAATWGAELAAGDGPGRIYRVEPTGGVEDDPNLTNARFPGNPTRSYRTREPLRVVGELTGWVGHPPEALRAMREHLAELERQGVEAVED